MPTGRIQTEMCLVFLTFLLPCLLILPRLFLFFFELDFKLFVLVYASPDKEGNNLQSLKLDGHLS